MESREKEDLIGLIILCPSYEDSHGPIRMGNAPGAIEFEILDVSGEYIKLCQKTGDKAGNKYWKHYSNVDIIDEWENELPRPSKE